jgi:leucyl/phenylalanyl-tRNA--protein transferase
MTGPPAYSAVLSRVGALLASPVGAIVGEGADDSGRGSAMAYIFEPERADETGLVAVGGDLEPPTLVHAYRSGVFPWFGEDDPILWWSPDPRAVFELDGLYISRRLARTRRSGKFALTVNRAFRGVIRACADREGGTWLTREMVIAYERLHRLGIAHSVEAWRDGKLAGGIYGVALAGFFAGESMFARVSDASKVALAYLVDHLRARGFRLFDTQVLTGHTAHMGAIEIPRREYLGRLREALMQRTTFL